MENTKNGTIKGSFLDCVNLFKQVRRRREEEEEEEEDKLFNYTAKVYRIFNYYVLPRKWFCNRIT